MVLRYFNVYGPRRPKRGAYALVLGIFLRAQLRGEPLTIHGDGVQRRDFVHVNDVVRANIMAYESDVRRSILNVVGSGTDISIKELADLISPNPGPHAAASGIPKRRWPILPAHSQGVGMETSGQV